MAIGNNIREKRHLRSMTQKELAKMTGLGITTIQGYESGKFIPKQENLEKIAKALDVSVDYFRKGDEITEMKGCKFCNMEDDHYSYASTKVNLGCFGEYEIAVYFSNETGTMGVDFGKDGYSPVVSDKAKIMYCPYCGAKIGKEENHGKEA